MRCWVSTMAGGLKASGVGLRTCGSEYTRYAYSHPEGRECKLIVSDVCLFFSLTNWAPLEGCCQSGCILRRCPSGLML